MTNINNNNNNNSNNNYSAGLSHVMVTENQGGNSKSLFSFLICIIKINYYSLLGYNEVM